MALPVIHSRTGKRLSAAISELPYELKWLLVETIVKEACFNHDREWRQLYLDFYHGTTVHIRKKVAKMYLEYVKYYTEWSSSQKSTFTNKPSKMPEIMDTRAGEQGTGAAETANELDESSSIER